MAKYYTSDLHFGHDKIIQYCKRPFADAKEQDRTLIANFNSVVGENDTVYHMGDFTYRNAFPPEHYLQQLNGQWFFILGNHDKVNQMRRLYSSCPGKVAGVEYYKEISTGHKGMNNVLFHYPIITWNHILRGWRHLYGHTHANYIHPHPAAIHVGIDSTPYYFKEGLIKAPWMPLTEDDLDEIHTRQVVKSGVGANIREGNLRTRRTQSNFEAEPSTD